MRPEQVHLKPEVARKLGPMGRVRKKRQLALHASLLRSVSSSKEAMRVGE